MYFRVNIYGVSRLRENADAVGRQLKHFYLLVCLKGKQLFKHSHKSSRAIFVICTSFYTLNFIREQCHRKNYEMTFILKRDTFHAQHLFKKP